MDETIRPKILKSVELATYDAIESTGLPRPESISQALNAIIENLENWTAPKGGEETPANVEKLESENRALLRRIDQLEQAIEKVKDGDAGQILELRRMRLKEQQHADKLIENQRDRELKLIIKAADATISERSEKHKTVRTVLTEGDLDGKKLFEDLLGSSPAIDLLRAAPELISGKKPDDKEPTLEGGKYGK